MTPQSRLVCRLVGLTLFAALVLAAGAVTARAETQPMWVPNSISTDQLAPLPTLFYQGLSGRIVGASAAEQPRLQALGARGIDLRGGEALYVYLVESADQAEFEPPARVLDRSGHEVIVATPGETPRLTAEAESRLSGLKEPVRVGMQPIVWPEEALVPAEAPDGSRTPDPLIQDMVNSLTWATYGPSWQTLEDFVTRSTMTPQNDQATQWILDRFQSFGLSAEFHYYTQSGQQRRNVIATIPGQVYPDQVVYICGHLDSTSPTPSTCAPGGDDNGSGTNTVLEAARIMSQYLFQYTVKFACFNGEEQGLLGSAAYVASIAQAGENVVGVFNADMVAYRGTDPAPADLVIYTNSASQALATTLSQAIADYTPGEIEPVVLVEALSGSDHASFWNNGYHAICAIEDEAWGSDFCPWYHTCDDLISRYPQDYVISCARAVMAATATTAMPINPQGSYLVYQDSELDDDNSGGSSGNGDGSPNPGEVIELYVTLRNVGNAPATNVTGQLSSSSEHVTVLTASSFWNDIPAGDQGTNPAAFIFEVSGEALDQEPLPFTLDVTDDSGVRQFGLQFTVTAPLLTYYTHDLDDITGGNANGIIDPGEVIYLPVTLANLGGMDASGVQATLTGGPHVTVINGASGAGQIPMGSQVELGPAFSVAVSGEAVAGEILDLSLQITAGSGYQADSSFKIKVGTRVYDEVEHMGPWSLASPGDNATTGRWVQVDPNGTIYNGQQCQPEDDHTPDPGVMCFVTGQGSPGGAAGEEDVDGGITTLTSPMIDLAGIVTPRVTYYRWYTNNLGNNPNEDEWVVQVSSDGGSSWVDLERTTSSDNSWQQRSFLLTDYITPSAQVMVRFIASDTGSNSLVEAAVDDFEISGAISPVAVDEGAPALRLALSPAHPTPAHGGSVLSYTLPSAGEMSLKLYDAAGRCLRTLREGKAPAGTQRIVWDGRNDAGVPVAPGIYFCRLRAGEGTRMQRVVLLP